MDEAVEAVLEEIMAEFPYWEPFQHVSRDDQWYARRPNSSPPAVVGPVPLRELRDAIAARETQERMRR